MIWEIFFGLLISGGMLSIYVVCSLGFIILYNRVFTRVLDTIFRPIEKWLESRRKNKLQKLPEKRSSRLLNKGIPMPSCHSARGANPIGFRTQNYESELM